MSEELHSRLEHAARWTPWLLCVALTAAFGYAQNERNAHRELAESYLAEIERLDGARAVLDQYGRIREWNRGMEELFGHKANKVVGYGIAFLLPDDMKEQHRDAFEDAMKDPTYGRVQSIVCDAIDVTGASLRVEIRARIENRLGEPVAIATFDRVDDIKRVAVVSVQR